MRSHATERALAQSLPLARERSTRPTSSAARPASEHEWLFAAAAAAAGDAAPRDSDECYDVSDIGERSLRSSSNRSITYGRLFTYLRFYLCTAFKQPPSILRYSEAKEVGTVRFHNGLVYKIAQEYTYLAKTGNPSESKPMYYNIVLNRSNWNYNGRSGCNSWLEQVSNSCQESTDFPTAIQA